MRTVWQWVLGSALVQWHFELWRGGTRTAVVRRGFFMSWATAASFIDVNLPEPAEGLCKQPRRAEWSRADWGCVSWLHHWCSHRWKANMFITFLKSRNELSELPLKPLGAASQLFAVKKKIIWAQTAQIQNRWQSVNVEPHRVYGHKANNVMRVGFWFGLIPFTSN